MASLTLSGMAIFGPGIATGLVSSGPQIAFGCLTLATIATGALSWRAGKSFVTPQGRRGR